MAAPTVFSTVFNAEFGKLTGGDRLTAQMAVLVQKAAEHFRIDPKSMQPFEQSAMRVATRFQTAIGGAEATGLTNQVTAISKKMEGVRLSMIKDAEKMAALQAELGTEMADDLKEGIRDKIKAVEREMRQRERMLDKELAAVEAQIKRRDEAIEAHQKREKEWASKGKLQKIEAGAEMADGFVENLSKMDPKDFGGMAKALLGGVGKLAGKAEGAAGAAAAAGGSGAGMAEAAAGLAAGVGAAAAAAAAVVAAVAAIVALFIAADSATKDLNKSLLEGAGAGDLANASAGGLATTLDAARGAAHNVALEFRKPQKEILKIIADANEAGLTFKEMKDRMSEAGDETEAFTNLTRTAVIYSTALGVSTKEITDATANWMHDFGMSQKQVQESFSAISAAAATSGMGTKRFYGFVTQATQGMALYNVRIDEAASLIMTLGKSLGEANAAQFVQGLAKGFAADSYQERFKRILITGQDDMNEIMSNSAVNTAEAFAEKFGSEVPKGLEAAMAEINKTSGLPAINLKAALGGEGTPKDKEAQQRELVKLGQMSERNMRKLLQAAESPEQYRELEKLVELTRGMSGGLGETAKSMDSLDMGGKLAAILQSGLGGTSISEMTAIELAAYEGYAGVGGEQLMELRKVDRQLKGQYESLTDMKAKLAAGNDLTAEDIARMEELGATLDESGKNIITANGQNLDSYSDFIQAQGDLTDIIKKPMSEEEKATAAIVSNTESIMNNLDTHLAGGFEVLADILQTFYNAYMGITPKQVALQEQLLTENAAAMDQMMANIGNKQADISQQKEKLTEAQTPAERQAIRDKIATLESEIKAEQDRIKLVQKHSEQVRAGTSAEQKQETYVGFANEESKWDMVTGALQAGFTEVTNPLETVADMQNKYGMEAAVTERQALLGGVGVQATASAVQTARGEAPVEATKPPPGVPEAVTADAAVEADAKASEAVVTSVGDVAVATEDAAKDAHTDADKALKAEAKNTEKGVLSALEKESIRKVVGQLRGKGASAAQQAEAQARLEKGGTLTPYEVGLLGDLAQTADAASFAPPVQDFMYRGNAMGGTITPINQADQLLGMKPGGAVDKALQGAGSGGNIFTFHINGGDPNQVYAVVKRALQESGVRPPPGGR